MTYLKKNIPERYNGKYILNSRGNPKQEPSFKKWGRWLETHDRTIARDVINGVTISTVFLAMNHNYMPGGAPILFETMIFTDAQRFKSWDDHQMRYQTRQEALAGHEVLLKEIFTKGELAVAKLKK